MPKIAFLFPGQGAQTVGMCRELDHELAAVRSLFDRAAEVLGFDLRKLCFEGPAEALEATDVSQPAIFVASLAALESLKVSDPGVVEACQGAAGLSLGEYTALVFAGAMDFAAGLEVVRRRGQAMQAASLANSQRHVERTRPRRGEDRRALSTGRSARSTLEGEHAGPRQCRGLG